MAANPYEYVFDIMGILKAEGMLPVLHIEGKFQQLRGDLVTRRRETIRRILETGHDRGVFYKHETRVAKGCRTIALWGYTPEEFSQPDKILESTLGSKWTGTLPQREALLRYHQVLICQEQNQDLPLEEVAVKAGVSRSIVTRAGSFFQVTSPSPRKSYYFSSRLREAILTADSRLDILDRIGKKETEESIRRLYSLTTGEYLRLTQLREAVSMPTFRKRHRPSRSRK